MKIAPLNVASTAGIDLDKTAQRAEDADKAGAVDPKAGIDPEKLRLAREFEQIFLRKMLSSLEKTGKNTGGASSASSAGDAYGSMVVSALAEAVSKGGGIGLAEVIARAASQPTVSPQASAEAIEAAVANATQARPAVGLGSGLARVTPPENVGITIAQPPSAATYTRPAPSIVNQNHDIHDLLKDPNQ
jgi:Rod binding domain-containing protein